MYAVFCRGVIPGGLMHETTIVPNYDIADLPGMGVLCSRDDHAFGKFVNNVITFYSF